MIRTAECCFQGVLDVSEDDRFKRTHPIDAVDLE